MRVALSNDIPRYDKDAFEFNFSKGFSGRDGDPDNRRDDLCRPTYIDSEQARRVWEGGVSF